jgi:hypothetical protein
MGTASPPAADRAHIVFQHAVTAGISQGPDLAQDADGRKVFLHDQFLDDGLEGI